MPQLIVLCGPAFSGKTTLGLALHDEMGFEMLAADWIMAERKSHPPFTDKDWQSVHDEVTKRTRELLSAGRDVVVDDTAWYRAAREDYKELAQETKSRMHLVVLDISEQELLKRALANRARATRPDIQEAVLKRHVEEFEWPSAAERPIVLDAKESLEGHIRSLKAALGSQAKK